MKRGWRYLIGKLNCFLRLIMAADRKCCVPDCESTHENNILHIFPNPQKDCYRFRTWTFAVGGSVLTLDDTYVYKYRRVCHLHFEDRYRTRSKMLSKNAVPTLYLKGLVMPQPLADTTNKSDVAQCDQEIATTSTSDLKIELNPSKTSSSLKIKQLEKKIEILTRKNERCALKMKKSLKLAENKTFQRALKKSTSLAAVFTAMQFREVDKRKGGRRFTEEEKKLALSIYKQGAQCYRFLETIFILPSSVTLSRMVSRAALNNNNHHHLFQSQDDHNS